MVMMMPSGCIAVETGGHLLLLLLLGQLEEHAIVVVVLPGHHLVDCDPCDAKVS